MHSTLTSYLLQAEKCELPHLGSFNVEYKKAKTDIVNNEIIAPAETIVFKEEDTLISPPLIHYISKKKSISEEEAQNSLYFFCKDWRDKIEAGETLYFKAVGSLKKNEEGKIDFTKDAAYTYSPAVPAVRVLHKNAQHDILVGDNATTSTMMNKYYTEEVEEKKSSWPLFAAILAGIALLILFYSFYAHKISSTYGNQNNTEIKTEPETYTTPAK